jgi:glucosamine-6-phosphate deaminase
MKIHIISNTEELSRLSAKHIIDCVRQNPYAVLGLATGSSPLGIYSVLIEDHKKHKTSYKHVTTFNLDEYVGIHHSHSQSYTQYMNKNFFNFIDIDTSRIHMPNASSTDDLDACISYNHLLKNHPIDIQLLGLGTNGHIGFNEPFTSFDLSTHITKLDNQTRLDNSRFFAHIDDVPTHAITMGISNIMASKKILLVVMGIKKAQAVYDMLYGEVSPALPASILRYHPNVELYMDVDAASLLPK